MFKNRKTVARRHGMWAPHGDPAMIAVTARFFMIPGDKKNRTAIVGRPQGLSQKSKGLLTDIARAPYVFPLSVRKPYDFHTISLRSPYGSDSERRRKSEQEIVRCPYEL